MWSVHSIKLGDVETIWPVVAPLLAPAIEYAGGRIDLESVFEALMTKHNLLWVAYQEDNVIAASFTTRVAKYPRKTMLVIECAGGSDMKEWVGTAAKTFENFARDSGYDGVEMYGRPGWDKMLTRYGWKRTMVLCEVDVGAPLKEEQNA